ncbi:enoyl-CoA hydratase [Albimonas donghaensis]|uniref:3-hydroxyisobutyryl-CoA hydrolase n=1 Tax=Albimonas donghaensis TaxID=356660 RepID=A0A1H2YQQ5_9RHOB|nr:enoyl-CoA hydratase/isomerase family protein [Albimonas donghaensis]SDX07345.1 enoyl-CoA hydratase [Albimonas donghaensis]
MAELIVAKTGKAGRLTLNRPDQLNALTHGMALGIEAALLEWKDDPEVALVVIDAAPGRAFGAGGDIKAMWAHGSKGDFAFSRGFWTDEYRMNSVISNYPKPVVTVVDGIVMGGGVGVASHASHRVASEKTLLAMPETGIGLLPDVGGTWILANAPGRFGEYLGLTGTRIGVADAILTGFTDSYVPSADLAALIATLEETGDVSAVAKAAKDPKTAVEPAVAPFLESIRAEIESIFDCTTPMAILEDLKASDSAWAQDAAKAIARACPLSVACTLIGVRDTRDMDSLEEALAHELRFTWRSQEIGELNEGVRAQLIDKDRDPKWKWPRLEDVWPDRAMAMFAPLGDNELKL